MKPNKYFFLILFLLSGKIFAGNNLSVEPVKSAPVFDGKVDELYKSGILFNSFKQLEPDIFAEPSVKTEIYFLYDQQNIYIAGNLYQPKNGIKSSNGRKDSPIILDGDAIGIVIDPLNNGNSAYFFSINPSNAIVDGTLDAYGIWDFKWDAIFNSATSIEDDHWSFEFQLPLSSISFQDKDEQDWGLMFRREYAATKEIILSQIVDKNQPFRISDFHKIKGLAGLKKETNLFFTPYSFYSFRNNINTKQNESKTKFGGEVKYNPLSSMTILATVNPDFAQIETDKLIINVDDVPTSYPEKRPFFTESSDLYPGLAVNTRNIEDIDVGIKLRDVRDNIKYDLTWVLDSKQNKWYTGDFRWTDNQTFYVDLIGGIKQQKERTDYNFTTNLRTWFFDKRLTAYTWFGTINKQNAKNEFESVNSVRWVTRELTIAVWNHFKTKYYNPNITGHNTLSNEILFDAWISYSSINESGFFRVITPQIKNQYVSFYTNPELSYDYLTLSLNTTLNLGNALGNWNFDISYFPSAKKYFRYRNVDGFSEDKIFQDAFSDFVLVEQNKDGWQLDFNSDYSKIFGTKFSYDNRQVRKSSTDNFSGELYWKIAPTSVITYSLEYVNLSGSEYQNKYNQVIHRVKAEYNITDKINLRGIVQLNDAAMTSLDNYESSNPVINFTLSWQYMSGSYIYLVYNKQELNWSDRVNSSATKFNDQSITLKINNVFNIY
ncbi:MAG: carbohydrate binding family 9 domain-containing protein [Ignavibacteriales bacterium]|nr:carbohydrate binding family 9 domain-containing protein [Ignavibacteriales bacterium]